MAYETAGRALITKETSPEQVEALCFQLGRIRGMHKVTLDHQTTWNHEAKQAEPTGWRTLIYRGTGLAVHKGRELVVDSGFQAEPNSDHDHAACIERAAKMGVPAAWAHTPESYLSA